MPMWSRYSVWIARTTSLLFLLEECLVVTRWLWADEGRRLTEEANTWYRWRRLWGRGKKPPPAVTGAMVRVRPACLPPAPGHLVLTPELSLLQQDYTFFPHSWLVFEGNVLLSSNTNGHTAQWSELRYNLPKFQNLLYYHLFWLLPTKHFSSTTLCYRPWTLKINEKSTFKN